MKYRKNIESIQINNLVLNISKMKELLVDLRKRESELNPVLIRAAAEIVDTITFLGIHITSKLNGYFHTNMIKKNVSAYFFRHLKRFSISKRVPLNFCRCATEDILMGCISTKWLLIA